MSDSNKPRRDFPLERFVDSLILSRAYFDGEGRLQAERLVGDALLLCRLVYPDTPPEADTARADSPHHNGRRSATTETADPSTDHETV